MPFRPLKVSKILIAFAGVLLLAACSSSGTMQISKSNSETIVPGKTVVLTVTPAISGNSSSDSVVEVTTRLRSALFGRLQSEGVFKSVYHTGEPADYRMNVKVTEASEVSQGARLVFGVLAGSNKVSASVSLINLSNGASVIRLQASGESASHPFSTEAGLDDAVRELTTKIILALRSH